MRGETDRINKIITLLIIVVIFIFGILFFTMSYDSEEDLVGEIETECSLEVYYERSK